MPTCLGIWCMLRRATQTKALLLNYHHWLVSKLATYGVQALIADTQFITDSELQQLGRALRLSAHVLARDPGQLAVQLIGRLHDIPGRDTTCSFWQTPPITCRLMLLVPRGGKHLTAPGALLATLAGHDTPVYGALLLPDARRVLSWSDDDTLRLWDLQTGAARTLEGHNDHVHGALLLPDERRVLSWSKDKTFAALGPRNRCRANLRGPRRTGFGRPAADRRTPCALMVRGQHLAALGPRNRRGANGLTAGHRRLGLGRPAAVRRTPCSSPGLRAKPCGSGISKPAPREPSRAMTARFWAPCCCPLNATPSPGLGTTLLRLWDLEETGAARTFEGHDGTVWGALLLPDERRVLSWSGDKTLRLWDLETGVARTARRAMSTRSMARCSCPTNAVLSHGQLTTPCGSGTASKPARR